MTVTSPSEEAATTPSESAAHRLRPRARTLLGPGPSNVHPTVTEALGKPMIGHLDPQFLTIMDELQQMLREVFQTENQLTIAVSGTGSAGMEAILVNLIEPGDEALVCVNGVFGQRMSDIVGRAGGVLHRIDRPWGEVFDVAEIEAALDKHPATAIVAIVHAETSTGAHQPLEEIGALCQQRGVLLVVDAVTSLAGTELFIDQWGIDACYSGTQKCLSCPPGLAPVTLGPRAERKLDRRSTRVASWYLDFSMIRNYWSAGGRAYHHTAPISMNYALHQALGLVLEEGLEERWHRHRLHSRALMAGMTALGFEPFAARGHRLPMLNAVRLPQGLDDAAIRTELLQEWDIEIGGGLADLAGKVWRIGLMGESARRTNVMNLLAALEGILHREGLQEQIGLGLAAATDVYTSPAEAA